MSDSKIISLIQKLLSHEQSAREIGNQAEAEAFATKIAALLAQHKLEMSEVEYKAQEIENPFGRDNTKKAGGNSTPQWRMSLAMAIAGAFFCHISYSTKGNQITFYGRASDRKAAIEMYETLSDAGVYLAKKEWKLSPLSRIFKFNSGEHAIAWRKSFLRGFADGISRRLRDQYHITQGHANSTGQGIILREKIELQKYIETFKFREGTARKATSFNADAYHRGLEHGSTAGLNRRLSLGNGK